MIKPSVRELADLVVTQFDRRSSISIEDALTAILRGQGIGKFQSEDIAFEMAGAVLKDLKNRPLEEMPFQFARSDDRRLVGKERSGRDDNSETAFAKHAWAPANELLDHLVTLHPNDFEVVCAAALVLSGAHEMKALCTGDEGGIDFFGRLMVRPPSDQIAPGLLYTTILPKQLLILGQAKRFSKDFRVGRPDIQKFKGQIADCMEKYAGNTRPPSHRVPPDYYQVREPHLGVFITTSQFAETAGTCVEASGVVLVAGFELAHHLVRHRVGVDTIGDGVRFSKDKLAQWLEDRRRQLV